MFLLELNNISADLELECVAVSSFLPPVENAWTWGLRRCCCRSLDGYSATKSWVITSAWTFMLQRFLRLILVEKTDAQQISVHQNPAAAVHIYLPICLLFNFKWNQAKNIAKAKAEHWALSKWTRARCELKFKFIDLVCPTTTSTIMADLVLSG